MHIDTRFNLGDPKITIKVRLPLPEWRFKHRHVRLCEQNWGSLGNVDKSSHKRSTITGMSKRGIAAAHKFPSVFIACPYDEPRFGYTRFKRELDLLPWTCTYANTTLHTWHLLARIKELISEADFSLFDLLRGTRTSHWNSASASQVA